MTDHDNRYEDGEPVETFADYEAVFGNYGWQCSCGIRNRMNRAFCFCGRFWQRAERELKSGT